MASLIRNVSKASLLRQSTLNRIHAKNASSSTDTPSPRNSSVLPVAIGCLSLGIGVAHLAQSNLLKKYMGEEPAPIKAAPDIEPRLFEEIINGNRRINQLESVVDRLREDIRERDRAAAREVVSVSKTSDNGRTDVFELSKIIEANDLASENRHRRELEQFRAQMIREHLLKVEGEVLKVKKEYRPTFNKIKELEANYESQLKLQAKESSARLLWITCQSLMNKMRNEPQKPLENDPAYGLLRVYADGNNRLAIAVLDSIPVNVLKEGVQSENLLIDRFNHVEKVCRRVAMVDEKGGGVTKYLLSYLQSLFLIDSIPVSEEEVTGKVLVDPSSWKTHDILARVKYCLVRRDIEQALRYANQLRGQSRFVARDWIRDARLHLETLQVFNILSAHAEAIAVEAMRQNFVE